MLRHLPGTELQGTSVLHETSTGSTTTQHSLLHTRHGHALAQMGPDRAVRPATVLPPLLPLHCWRWPSHQAGVCPGLHCHSAAGAWSSSQNCSCSGAWHHGTEASWSKVTLGEHMGAHTPCPCLQALGAWPGLVPGVPLRAHHAGTEPRQRHWDPGPHRRRRRAGWAPGSWSRSSGQWAWGAAAPIFSARG